MKYLIFIYIRLHACDGVVKIYNYSYLIDLPNVCEFATDNVHVCSSWVDARANWEGVVSPVFTSDLFRSILFAEGAFIFSLALPGFLILFFFFYEYFNSILVCTFCGFFLI